MRIIAENTRLHSLNLSKTCVSSDGLASLCFLPHLSKLELNDCKNLSQSIPSLRSLSNLEHVSVSQSRLLSPCHIISALKNATSLSYLDLSWCQSSAGSARRALVTIPRLQKLNTLYMDNACLPVELFTSVLLLPNISRLGACGYSFPAATDIPLALLMRLFRVPSTTKMVDEQIQSAFPLLRIPATFVGNYVGVAIPTCQLGGRSPNFTASVRGASGVDAAQQSANSDDCANGIPLAGDRLLENQFDGPAAPLQAPALWLQRLSSLTMLRLRWANVRILHLCI